MTTRLTWPGTAAYAAVALIEAIQAIRLIRHEDAWAGSQIWAAAGILVCVAVTGLLFVVASITRMPLVGDDVDHLAGHLRTVRSPPPRGRLPPRGGGGSADRPRQGC